MLSRRPGCVKPITDAWANLEVELLRREVEAVTTGKAAEPSGPEQGRKKGFESSVGRERCVA